MNRRSFAFATLSAVFFAPETLLADSSKDGLWTPAASCAEDIPLPSIKVELQFVDDFCGKRTDAWTDTQTGQLREAATHFQTVWSSAQFRSAVMVLPPLFYRDGRISGPDLYAKLTEKPAKVMKLSVNNKHKECARTDPGCAETLMHQGYLNSTKTTMADLVNTLSHECIHYSGTGESWDADNGGNWNAYVSYGIGCLTQNLSGVGPRCDYDPSKPVSEKMNQPREFPEHATGGAWRGKKT